MDDIEDYARAQRVFFLDTNLSSPVLDTEIQATQTFLADHIKYKTDLQFRREVRGHKRQEHIFFEKLCKLRGWKKADLTLVQVLPVVQYPDLERGFLESTPRHASDYQEIGSLLRDLEGALCAGLKKRGLPEEEVLGTADALINNTPDDYRNAYEQFSNLFGRAESRTKTHDCTWTLGHIGAVKIWITSSYALVQNRGALYASSLNQVLMLKDKLSTRFMLLTHVHGLGLSGRLITYLRMLFSWQDNVLEQYGNAGYNVLKAVEPLYKTRISHVVDNVFGADTAYTRMITKMEEKQRKLPVIGTHHYTNAIRTLCEIVEQDDSIEVLVEMFGCQKSCGHPIIDPRLGGLSAAEEARSPDLTSLVDAQNLRNTFCHIVLCSYVSQHGVWPNLIHTRKGSKLHTMNERQERRITYNSYPLDDWTNVEWGKFMDFDYFPNYLDLMDDKAISLYRSDLRLSWDRDKKPKSNRRLLLEVMSRKDIDVKELVDRVSARNVPEDWRVVSLYPKEREFKLEPRMFAMLTLEMRCFFTAIEANLANSLFRYLPQQTMTKTKTQNQERFLKFTDPSKNRSSYILFLEIDLSRWNLKWRELTVHMLGHDINNMFGLKGTYTVTHWFFALCQIIVRVGGLRPDGVEQPVIPESSLAWRDHKGGFEGLNQKLWTAATYAMVEMALIPLIKNGTIISYELIGQGDNQVLRIEIAPNGESREVRIPVVRDQVNQKLEEACRSVGQEVKPEENVESTSVLTYSKDVYVNGVEYPTSLKKHSRLFPVTSMDFPSVANNTRAILAGCVAGGENAKRPLRSLIIGWYHSLRYLRATSRGFCIHGKSSAALSEKELLAAVTIPASIGGYCGVSVASFFYKGGSDPLGKEISGLRLLAESSNRVGQICSTSLRALEERYCIRPDPNLETLIDNPYSLPLSKSSSPMSKVGDMTLGCFKPLVVNKSIKPLLESSVTTSESKLRQDLISIEPFNPVLVHDLYESSGFGTIRLMKKMFINTRTVQSVAQASDGSITHVFLRADLNDTHWFKEWVSGLPNRGYSGRSSYNLVSQFRQYWGKDLHGITTHQPLDFSHASNSTRHPSSIKWSAHSATDLLTRRGPLTGYVGTATKEKRSEHGYRIVDTGAPSRSLMKLQLIRSQAYGNPAFNLLLDLIGLTRSSTILSSISDLLPKVRGGSISHRYSSSMRMDSASYVGPLNFVTHIRLDTNSVGEVSGSSLNYPIMMQEFMITAQAGAKLLYLNRSVRSGELVLDIPDLEPLPDDSLQCKDPKFLTASLPKTKLLYTEDILLARTYDSMAKSMPRHAMVKPDEYGKRSSLLRALVTFCMETLRDANRAKVLADTRGHEAIPSKYQLDIAEAHAFGPSAIIDAIAYAIVLTTIRDTYRTLAVHPDRWDDGLFAVFQIRACLAIFSNYWSHPLLTSHPDSVSLRHSSLKYSRVGNLQTRLIAKVRRSISLIYSTVDHPFWSASLGVFSDSTPSSLVETLSLLGAREIMHLRLIQHPLEMTYTNIYSSYARLPVHTNMTPEESLELLRTRFIRLSEVFFKSDDVLLKNRFVALSKLVGVKFHNDDVRTVLRHARSLSSQAKQIPPARIKKNPLFPLIRDHCRSCYPESRDRRDVMWARYKQRIHGGLSSAGYTWAPLLGEIECNRKVLIVGSGNGGLADLLLTYSDCEVIGLDLEKDMPSNLATLLNYIPCGISEPCSQRYLQSDLSLTTSGDYLDPSVRTQLFSSVDNLQSVFIDATGPSASDLAAAAIASLEYPSVKVVYVRLIGSKEEVLESYENSRQVCRSRMWCLNSSHHETESILELRRGRGTNHVCLNRHPVSDAIIDDSLHELIPARRQELLETAGRDVFSWEEESVHEIALILKELCVSLLDKPKERQLIFADRFNLILGYSTFYAASQDYPKAVVQDWISEERITTDMFSYNLNSATETHLLRYVPRLCSLVTDSLML
ncbi:RNA dependent RNA polymerase [Plasmopara viticola lesion associated mononegaambi virus 7]|uniref:RNA-directed RNA polymerase L n=1 Tax=Plasmopara viticola lesion associated mononegaambi virus 7 TaxID=2692019 RepID=A0A6B9Q4R9_9MONO|nr:RNA dependent RNA polymerase [Plasmopara viticola lesion associated mononegaambi virus 7]QHD64782.1 RNA dependent RNA polymerase [Plasmopara viticola lesion associated mononegaambi virus 7]